MLVSNNFKFYYFFVKKEPMDEIAYALQVDVRQREREREAICVCVCEREREKDGVCCLT